LSDFGALVNPAIFITVLCQTISFPRKRVKLQFPRASCGWGRLPTQKTGAIGYFLSVVGAASSLSRRSLVRRRIPASLLSRIRPTGTRHNLGIPKFPTRKSKLFAIFGKSYHHPPAHDTTLGTRGLREIAPRHPIGEPVAGPQLPRPGCHRFHHP